MNTNKELLVQAIVANSKKSGGVAWLMFLLLGGVGAHRFYLGKTGTGAIQLILFIFGVITFGIMFIPLAIWLFVDLFLINAMVRDHTNLVQQAARYEVMANQE